MKQYLPLSILRVEDGGEDSNVIHIFVEHSWPKDPYFGWADFWRIESPEYGFTWEQIVENNVGSSFFQLIQNIYQDEPFYSPNTVWLNIEFYDDIAVFPKERLQVYFQEYSRITKQVNNVWSWCEASIQDVEILSPTKIRLKMDYSSNFTEEEWFIGNTCWPYNEGIIVSSVPLISPMISGNQVLVQGKTADKLFAVSTLSENPGAAYKWQQSSDGENWTDIVADGRSAYSPGALTQTTYFRLCIYALSLGTESYSNEVTVTVKSTPIPQAITPSHNQNYILTYTPQMAYKSIEGKAIDSLAPQITYYDGLGRPMQDIQVHANLWYEDIVTPIAYDNMGRKDKDYLSYAVAGANGTFQPAAVSDQQGWFTERYQADGSYGYVHRYYEESPLSRVLREHMPGVEYANTAETRYSYGTNGLGEVAIWSLEGRSKSYYPPGTLFREVIYYLDYRTVVRYVDMQKRVVEERQANGFTLTFGLVTSYSYDSHGRLCLVVPPKAQSSAITKEEWESLVYRYTYDYRGRCIEKRLPGAAPIYYAYDKADRMAASQDGNQRGSNEWTIIK